ncbi:MAG: helix-turn-helix domain-containing protein [Pseudonocardia sp.]
MVASSPTVFRRYIALELGKLREAAGFTRDQVAKHLGCAVGTVRHLEVARNLPRPLEVRALMALYGVEHRTESFLALVDAARRGKDWWVKFPGVPKWLDLLLGMEASAVTMHSYDNTVIRGLFQTPAYAEAIIRAMEPELPDDEVQQRIEVRMVRQDVLTRRPDPPAVWCVMEESVLDRRPPKPEVMREQLEHLISLSELPKVHIQILPKGPAGLHAGLDGTFTILTFGPEFEGDPGVAYVQSRISGTYYENAAEIARYHETWGLVQLQALNPDESRALLARRAEEIT